MTEQKCRVYDCEFPANWHIWNLISNTDSFLCEDHMDSVQWQLVTQGRQGIESMSFYKKREESISSKKGDEKK